MVASTELGFLHNRLTHSLKVAQVGKSMAARLNGLGAGVDPILVETACLAHDIGHPPFGHAGEEALDLAIEAQRLGEHEALNRKREEAGDPALPLPKVWDGFEGNAQNLRVLTRLATHRDWEPPGLHLTRGSLLAATKYPWPRSLDKKGGRKWGAYEGDEETLGWMLEPVGVDAGVPFEGRLMDWADDVTYAVHDVDDWYRLGLIPLHQIFDFKLAADHPNAGYDENMTLAPFLTWVLEKWAKQGDVQDRQEIVRLMHALADRVSVEEPFNGSRVSKGRIQATVSDLICFFADAAGFSGIGAGYEGSLTIPDERRLLCDLLKELVWYYVIGGAGLAAQQHGQSRIVTSLVHWAHEDPDRLLPRDRCEEWHVHQDLTRAIADHVASLTEPMAITLYGKLSGNALGAITDTI